MSAAISKRGWWLFALMAVLWGMPYLFIKEAVDSISPPAIVAGRTLIGALILLPLALRSGALRPALKKWPWVLAFGAIEMAGPFLLLGNAERTLPSGLTGLLVATVPLVSTLIAIGGGNTAARKPMRLLGLLIGIAGVVVVVLGPGLGVHGDGVLTAIGEVLLVAVLYAIAPFIVARKLGDVPALGSITLSLLIVGVAYLPWAILSTHHWPTLSSGLSLIALGIFCTALAFVGFFALIKEVGPVNAPLFTYVNPIVALTLGVLILGEPVGLGLIIGAPIVLVGCWLAATGGRLRAPAAPRSTSA